MSEFWLIAKSEYRMLVGRRSFYFGTLGVPLLIAVIIALSIFFSTRGEQDDAPLGYVDLAGVLVHQVGRDAYAEPGDVELVAFADENAARTALEEGDIQAYYLLPTDYLQSRRVQLNYWDDKPSSDVQQMFDRYIRANLLAGQPQAVQRRILNGIELSIRSADGKREAGEEDFLNFFLPFGVGMFFFFIVMTSSGYLLQAVTTEKENRMGEVMFTSVSPVQLVGGKILGLMGVAFTQMAIWISALLIGVTIASRYVDFMGGLHVPWAFGLLLLVFFTATFAIIAGIMTTLGSMVTELQQGQQIAGLINMLFAIPFFFMVLIFTDPDSPILVGLTLFPTTAFMTIAMRWGVTDIPTWQLIVSWLSVAGTAFLCIYVASRVFRLGMLRYGQPISLRRLLGIVRTGGA